MKNLNISPLELGSEEGMAIINGTAVSADLAALALHDAHYLAVLSQGLIAMGVEALSGSAESFESFLAEVRPCLDQVEAARNVIGLVQRFQLLNSEDGVDNGSLRQDRYAIRTLSHWSSPELENLPLTHQQIAVESNSTTHNLTIDAAGGEILHENIFRALPLTSAMEKTYNSLRITDRILLSECTEIIKPVLNNSLPSIHTCRRAKPVLLMKSAAVAVAALQPELGFLANPVVSHVQNTEMSDQSMNSLALVSARYTNTSLDVLCQLSSSYLLALCQAHYLRAMNDLCFSTLELQFRSPHYPCLQAL